VVNEQPVYYSIEGQGRPVVLVHGFAEDGTVWENQVVALRNKFQFIIPNLPGSGFVTMEYFAECIKHILDKENISRVTMIGHSMGGYVTLAFAEKYANRLASLGLFHSTAFADSEEKKAARRRGIEFIQQNGAAKFLEQSIPNLFCSEFKNQQPAIVKQILARYSNFAAPTLVNYYEAMILRPDRTSVLKSFSQPVLFIAGRYDTAVPVEQALQQCYMPGLCYFHILEHSAHMGMWEQKEQANWLLEEFLLQGSIA
jgi:pimeloyl-ACP methyl ester carboxylesterase